MLSPPTISHPRLFQPWKPPVRLESIEAEQSHFIELPPVTSYRQLLDEPAFQGIKTQFLCDIRELERLAHRYVGDQFDRALDHFHKKLCEPAETDFDTLLPIYRETRFHIRQLVLQLRIHERDAYSLPVSDQHQAGNDYVASLLCECFDGINLCLPGVHSRFSAGLVNLQAASANGLDDRLYKARSDLYCTFVRSFMLQKYRDGYCVPKGMEVHWFNGLHNLYCDNLALHFIDDSLAQAYINDQDLASFLASVHISVNACTVLREIANDWSGQLIATLARVGCSHWLNQPAGAEENTAIGVNALNSQVFGPMNGLMGTTTNNPIDLTAVMDCTIDDSFHLKRHWEKMLAWITAHFYRASAVVFADISGCGGTATYIGSINELYFWVFESACPLNPGQGCAFTPDEFTSLQLPHLLTIDFSTWPELTAFALLTQAMRQTGDAEDIAAFFLSPLIRHQLNLLPDTVMTALTEQLREKLVYGDTGFREALSHRVCYYVATVLRFGSTALTALNCVDWLIHTPLLQPVLSQLHSAGVAISLITSRLKSWEIAEFTLQQIAELFTPQDCQRLFIQAFRLGQTELAVNLLLTGHCQAAIRFACQCGQFSHESPGGMGGLNYLQSLAPADLNRLDDNGSSLLHHAVRRGYLMAVRVLLKLPGVAVNVEDNRGRTPLGWAINYRQQAIIAALLTREDIDVNKAPDGDPSPLQMAAQNGQLAALRLLLAAQGVDVNVRDCSGCTPILAAVSKNDHLCVRALVAARGIDVNVTNNNGWTPLCTAAYYGHVECIQELLEAEKIQLNLTTYDCGGTPLFCAAKKNQPECLKVLLAQPGVSVNAASINSYTPLHVAASQGFDQCLLELLKRPDIDVNLLSKEGTTPLHEAVLHKQLGCLQLLLEHEGLRVNAVSEKRGAALNISCVKGLGDCVKVLLGVRGIDVNQKLNGCSPLSSAVRRGSLDIVHALLAVPGIDVNAANSLGMTPLHIAVGKGFLLCTKALLKMPGIAINALTNEGKTPLNYAAEHGRHHCLLALLMTGNADVNLPSYRGLTPLHSAVKANKPVCVAALVKAPGVDVNKVSVCGLTALQIAADECKVECINKLLEASGIMVNLATRYGSLPPLHRAARSGAVDCLRLLSRASGVDINRQCQKGLTALHLAASHGRLDCLLELLAVPGIRTDLTCRLGLTPEQSAIKNDHPVCALILGNAKEEAACWPCFGQSTS